MQLCRCDALVMQVVMSCRDHAERNRIFKRDLNLSSVLVVTKQQTFNQEYERLLLRNKTVGASCEDVHFGIVCIEGLFSVTPRSTQVLSDLACVNRTLLELTFD